MGGNNEFFENFERNKYLKIIPSMQRVNNLPVVTVEPNVNSVKTSAAVMYIPPVLILSWCLLPDILSFVEQLDQ